MPTQITNRAPHHQAPNQTETHPNSAQTPLAPPPIQANGPETDISRIRRTVADLLNPVTRLFESQPASGPQTQETLPSTTSDTFLSKCLKFCDRLARGFWGFVETATDFAKWLLERARELHTRNIGGLPTPTQTIDQASHLNNLSHSDPSGPAPKRDEKILFSEYTKKPADVICAIVGEAARREHERKEAIQLAERSRQAHLRHDAVDQIHEIDARNGVTNENAEIIINNMLSGWTSISAALNQILSAQTGEILSTKKKVS